MVEACLITCMMDLDCLLCARQWCPSASMLVSCGMVKIWKKTVSMFVVITHAQTSVCICVDESIIEIVCTLAITRLVKGCTDVSTGPLRKILTGRSYSQFDGPKRRNVDSWRSAMSMRNNLWRISGRSYRNNMHWRWKEQEKVCNFPRIYLCRIQQDGQEFGVLDVTKWCAAILSQLFSVQKR